MDLGISFLTPSIRSARAKSMLATTKSSVPTTDTRLIDTENDAEYVSAEKRRSSAKRCIRKGVFAPLNFRNCEDCGSIYFSVSLQAPSRVTGLLSLYFEGSNPFLHDRKTALLSSLDSTASA